MLKSKMPLDIEVPMLLPINIKEYFEAANKENLPMKLRATSIRLCLEGMLDLFFKDKIVEQNYITEAKWKKYPLYKKIEIVSGKFDETLKKKFDLVRHTGNRGAHMPGEVDGCDLTESIKIINEILIDVIVIYFQKYPVGTQLPVLTLLSALPPVYRVKVLERVWVNDKENLWLVDKLSMAYLKSDMNEEAFSFISQCFENEHINLYDYYSFIDKLQQLNSRMSKFDRSKGFDDTKRIFETLVDQDDVDNYKEFVMILSALVYGEDFRLKFVG